MEKRFTLRHYIGDAVLCVLLICVSVAVVFFARSRAMGENSRVRILCGEEKIAELELSEDITGYAVGNVIIEISGGRAYIIGSDCPDKVCMSMYGVDKNGGGAVCIPNKVVLEPCTSDSGVDITAG